MGGKASRLCCLQARNKKQRKKKQKEVLVELNDVADQSHGLKDLLQKITEHEQEIKAILQKHEEEKTTLSEAHKIDMESRTQELMKQAQKDADVRIETYLSEHTLTMKRELDEKCAELQKSHDQEKSLLKETYEKITSSLQETVEGLNSQLASFQEKIKQVEELVFNQGYKKHIEDHGSPGPFWEQELQSLHFVIEMKRELIHELEKKQMSHETTMDRNLALEKKVRNVEQENEALRAQTQNQAAITIRLTEELLNTQTTLEKEMHLREELQRDKEQLLHRAVYGDGHPPFSLPTNTQEVSMMVI
ncbi:coiled-coil domain-containing protein 69 [Pelobates fuscus]|uniref:coiled-coil domain-containing protein 69 n=1 Tax=Pelobates fuscus TaxID=191477 RepID=UPI002FE4D43D